MRYMKTPKVPEVGIREKVSSVCLGKLYIHNGKHNEVGLGKGGSGKFGKR
jgi:hypothetical protein